MAKYAMVTAEGAKRLGQPSLAGEWVEVMELTEGDGYFFIVGMLSETGEEAGLFAGGEPALLIHSLFPEEFFKPEWWARFKDPDLCWAFVDSERRDIWALGYEPFVRSGVYATGYPFYIGVAKDSLFDRRWATAVIRDFTDLPYNPQPANTSGQFHVIALALDCLPDSNELKAAAIQALEQIEFEGF